MCEKCFVQTKKYCNRHYLPVIQEGFIFNNASLKILRKITFKLFCGGGGENRKEPYM